MHMAVRKPSKRDLNATTGDDGLDPSERPEPTMSRAADEAGVPVGQRAGNAGGTMSETTRSRDRDLNEEDASGSA